MCSARSPGAADTPMKLPDISTSTHLALRAADVLGVLQYDETEQNWVKEE